MSKRQAAWWLMGYTPAETSYGAGVASGSLDKWFRTEEPLLMEWGGEETDDANEIKGYVGASEDGIDVTKKRGQVSVTMKPNVQVLGFLLASMFANDSVSGASDPYTHETVQPSTAVIRPKSFSIITGEDRSETATQWKHDGVVPTSIRLSWSQDNPAGEMSFTFLTDGDPTDASSVTAPDVGDALKGDRLRFEHIAMSLGAQGSASAITSSLRSLEITIEGDIQEEQRASRGTAVGTVFHGQNAPTVSVNIVMEGQEGDTIWGYWNNGTLLEFLITITNSADRKLILDVGSTRIPRDSGQIATIENGIVQVLNLNFNLLYNPTDGTRYTFQVLNDVAAYLA